MLLRNSFQTTVVLVTWVAFVGTSRAEGCDIWIANGSEYLVDAAHYDKDMDRISEHVIVDERDKKKLIVPSCDDRFAMLVYVPTQGLCYEIESDDLKDDTLLEIAQSDFVIDNLSKVWCFD